MRPLAVAHLGPTPYRDGLQLQEALVRARVEAREGGDSGPDWLLYPDHPPVLTVGRSPSEGNLRVPAATLAERGIELFEVARGGDVTWHGPGQLVGYPVCDLDRLGHDLHRFLRGLELALVDALAHWGIEGRQVPGRTGIWAGDDKIASIGIAVRRWMTYHGFALNVCPDLTDFEELIHPCGLHGIRMTSIARLRGPSAPSLEEVRRVVTEALTVRLGYAGAALHPAEAAWRAAGLRTKTTLAAPAAGPDNASAA